LRGLARDNLPLRKKRKLFIARKRGGPDRYLASLLPTKTRANSLFHLREERGGVSARGIKPAFPLKRIEILGLLIRTKEKDGRTLEKERKGGRVLNFETSHKIRGGAKITGRKKGNCRRPNRGGKKAIPRACVQWSPSRKIPRGRVLSGTPTRPRSNLARK